MEYNDFEMKVSFKQFNSSFYRHEESSTTLNKKVSSSNIENIDDINFFPSELNMTQDGLKDYLIKNKRPRTRVKKDLIERYRGIVLDDIGEEEIEKDILYKGKIMKEEKGEHFSKEIIEKKFSQKNQ